MFKGDVLHMKKRVVIILLTVILSINCTFFQAASLSDMQKEQQRIETQQAEAANKKKELLNTVNRSQTQKYQVETQATSEQKSKETLELALNDINKQIQDLEALIIKSDDEYNAKCQQFLTRAKVMYQYSEVSYLQVLIESKNILDFIGRVQSVTKLLKSDKQLMDDINTDKLEIERNQKLREVACEEQKQLIKEKNQTLSSLSSEQSSLETSISTSNAEIERINKEEAQLQEDSNKIAKLIASLQIKSGAYVAGKMCWPAPSGDRYSSAYGPRIHPIYHTQSFHTGQDIPAPGGSNIVTANAGTVILVVEAYSSKTGYGAYVVVDHGGGISTLYGHSSKILVSVGQVVAQGEVIAKVGTSGASTGFHLHFEVRINGEHTDPKQYITLP